MANLKDQLDELKGRLRITKITATRSIRTPNGDVFCAFSASFKHDGMGPGVDTHPEEGEELEIAGQGLTSKEMSAAYLYLQHRAYLLCLDSAAAEGSIPEHVALNMKTAASEPFARLLAKALRVPETTNDPASGG